MGKVSQAAQDAAKVEDMTQYGARIAALEEFAQGAAAFMQDIGERVQKVEEAVAKANAGLDSLPDVLNELRGKVEDVAHVSRATAENAPVYGDVFARLKNVENALGIRPKRQSDEG